MFSGIIQHTVAIAARAQLNPGLRLSIQNSFSSLTVGESIAVDGVCLTVTGFVANSFICDLSPETLRITTANHYQVGHLVNVERALCLGDRIGGHLLSGHCDGAVRLAEREQQGGFMSLRFNEILPEHQRYLVIKGSVALNGVSLTVNTVNEGGFSVMLVPHTLQHTNLSQLNVSDRVNIEYDQLLKVN